MSNIHNKHNTIIFYKNDTPVRLVVINKDTDIDKCIKVALEQHFENSILKDYYVKHNIKSFIIDMSTFMLYFKLFSVCIKFIFYKQIRHKFISITFKISIRSITFCIAT